MKLGLRCKKVVCDNGVIEISRDGKLHCIIGPAWQNKWGHRQWYQHGKMHRLDGPAETFPNGVSFYWLDGKAIGVIDFHIAVQRYKEKHQ